MKISKLIRRLPIFVFAATLAACAATRPIGEWRNPAFNGKVDNILVIGVTSRSTRQRLFEDRFVEALAAHGVTATPGYELLTSSMKLTPGDVERAIEGKGLDAVLVTRLVGVKPKEEYLPPPERDEEPGYFAYYETGLEQDNRGYYSQYKVVALESNLYDAATGELLWSMQSEPISRSQPRQEIEAQIRFSIDTLAAQGLIGE